MRRAKPQPKPYNLYDTGGLYPTVSPARAKWWRLKYRFAEREKRIGLGAYPVVSLAKARDARDKARLTIRAGNDPGMVKRAENARQKIAVANTFEGVAREWLAVKKNGWVASQYWKERRRLEIHAFPWIGKTPISDLGTAEIRPLLDRLVTRPLYGWRKRLRIDAFQPVANGRLPEVARQRSSSRAALTMPSCGRAVGGTVG